MMNPQAFRAFMQFMQNPAALFQQRGLPAPPQSAMQSPKGLIQYMLNAGGVTQEQYNRAAAQAKQLQNDPQFMQMLQGAMPRK